MNLLRVLFLNMLIMPCNFFSIFRSLRDNRKLEPFIMPEGEASGFPVHPSASELAEALLTDPDALRNETYEVGLFDEDGDYYPQYSDDPSAMPEFIAPNSLGETAPESSPASDSQSTEPVSSETDSKSE